MSESLTISSGTQESFPSETETPDINRDQFNKLARIDRIWYCLMWPRHFSITDTDFRYLDALKVAHSCLRNYSTDQQAAAILKHAIPDRTLSLGEVMHLIRDAKQLFGKFIVRDKDFDTEKLLNRLYENADKAKQEGDLEAERKALYAIMKLTEQSDSGKINQPVVPQLPDITFKTYDEAEDAIIESSEENS